MSQAGKSLSLMIVKLNRPMASIRARAQDLGLGIAGTEIGVASAGTEKTPPGLMGVCPFALCKTQQTLVFRSPIFDGISVWAIETTQTLGR